MSEIKSTNIQILSTNSDVFPLIGYWRQNPASIGKNESFVYKKNEFVYSVS